MLLIDEDARQDALDALTDAGTWIASAAHWTEIDRTVATMAAAAATGDVQLLTTATAHLEYLSTRRATDAGKGPKTPPPEPVRDRLNETIHKIGK
ncbi:hypothetical protein Ga0074812_13075 [Parafrankia irregularis]|uniref:CATRA-Associated Small Protein domain-containing protein n=1 Tax=Parafrankia irregularis TaxID=795642 RepID=A0A0S4QX08_9ACTN|nr:MULTISPECIES: CATRA system-associated protein [Parafrankia]MBE3205820.1 hypothetical protein [Parafrankia sp. CH37]CUU59695.1 hypothetical protein Ga0074812_13075 [Parafrankia irregularis]